MFSYDSETGAVVMHQGDTGSYILTAKRNSGEDWGEDDRMILTIGTRENPVIQRYYRLDDAYGLGDGVVLIEFKNADTDSIPVGGYPMERRYVRNAIWQGTKMTERCADALTGSGKIVDGHLVRTKTQTTFTIESIYGEV